MTEHVSDEQLSALIDGELSSLAKSAVRDHIASCPSCAERHDALVEVVAGLRLRMPVRWSARQTAAVRSRLITRPQRRPVPVVAPLVVLVVGCLAAELPLLRAGASLARSGAGVLAAFAPSGLPTAPSAILYVLLAIAIVGPAVAYPLARWR